MKKAQIKIIGALIIALLVLSMAIFLIYKPGKSAQTQMGKYERENLHNWCVQRTADIYEENRLSRERGEPETPITDSDGDGAADGCDFCPSGHQEEDKDFDFMPDRCDNAPEDAKDAKCKVELDKDSGHCII